MWLEDDEVSTLLISGDPEQVTRAFEAIKLRGDCGDEMAIPPLRASVLAAYGGAPPDLVTNQFLWNVLDQGAIPGLAREAAVEEAALAALEHFGTQGLFDLSVTVKTGQDPANTARLLMRSLGRGIGSVNVNRLELLGFLISSLCDDDGLVDAVVVGMEKWPDSSNGTELRQRLQLELDSP